VCVVSVCVCVLYECEICVCVMFVCVFVCVVSL
jgi:hypothetical protein